MYIFKKKLTTEFKYFLTTLQDGVLASDLSKEEHIRLNVVHLYSVSRTNIQATTSHILRHRTASQYPDFPNACIFIQINFICSGFYELLIAEWNDIQSLLVSTNATHKKQIENFQLKLRSATKQNEEAKQKVTTFHYSPVRWLSFQVKWGDYGKPWIQRRKNLSTWRKW